MLTVISAGNGKIHTTNAYVMLMRHAPVKASCGRSLTPDATWQADGWSKMVETHVRLATTHVVYTCSGCVKKFVAAA